MLVISRKPHEKILIPSIRACIHVAAVQPGVVRVAINAPPDVSIMRGELADRAAEWGPPEPPVVVKHRRPRGLRKRLRVASMTLGLARLQLQIGFNREAAAAFGKAQRQLEALRRSLGRKTDKTRPRGVCLAHAAATTRIPVNSDSISV